MSKMSKAIAVLGVVAGLGVAALPLSSYAADGYDVATSTKVTAVVEGAVSISTNAPAEGISLGNLTPNGAVMANGTMVTVSSNADGATFDLNMTATDLETASGANKIDRVAPAKGTSGWGYKTVDTMPSDFTNIEGLAPIPAGGVSLGTDLTTTGAAEGVKATKAVNVIFGASAAAGQAEGQYSSTVTFTATVK